MVAAAQLPSQEQVKSQLYYSPLTGEFTWLLATKGHRAGVKAGSTHKKSGYVTIGLDGWVYLAHRLAFVYMTGSCPPLIDHDDRCKSNNAWDNLKPSDHTLNAQNVEKPLSTSSTGFRGVSPVKSGKFVAHIRHNNKTWNLGVFDTPQRAHEAYMAAKREHHPGFSTD